MSGACCSWLLLLATVPEAATAVLVRGSRGGVLIIAIIM